MEEKEKLFLEIIQDFDWKYDLEKYPNTLFAFKDDIIIFLIDFKTQVDVKKIIANYRLENEQVFDNSFIFFNYNKCWKRILNELITTVRTKVFLKEMVEKHLKMKKLNPTAAWHKRISNIQKHFKSK
jgi:hypothetical protein